MNQNSYRRDLGHHLVKQTKPFSFKPGGKLIDPGYVATRAIETRNQTKFDRIISNRKYKGNRRRRLLGRERARIGGGYDHRSSMFNELGNKSRKAIELP